MDLFSYQSAKQQPGGFNRQPPPTRPPDQGLGNAGQNGNTAKTRSKGPSPLRQARHRMTLVCVFLGLGFSLIALRLGDLMVWHSATEPELAYSAKVDSSAQRRADIFDRNGVLLATSVKSASLYADALEVDNPEIATHRLVRALPSLDPAVVLKRLSSRKRFVWIKRHLSPDQHYKVNALGIPGLHFRTEEKRLYPHHQATAHVVGHMNIDGDGVSGIERYFNSHLVSRASSLNLALDVRVNHILREEIHNTIKEFKAKGGSGLVMNVKTGEILGMVSLPDFDPNNPCSQDDKAHFNRNTLGVYELGSCMKLITTAMALETGTVTMGSRYDATKPLKISRFTINDYRGKNRTLTVPEIMMHSSNIAMGKMALDVGSQQQQRFLNKLGLLQQCSLESRELGKPLSPKIWRDVNTVTISYGHGIAISPVHMIAAVSSIINGGFYYNPTLIKQAGQPLVGQKVVSEQTSDQMRQLLRLVVTHGSGRKANVPGYMVGGKTGTAELATKKGYRKDARLSSFFGAFPMNDPEYAIYVMIDQPQGIAKTFGFAGGGWVAAPLCQEITTRIGPILRVPPVDEQKHDMTKSLLRYVKNSNR